MFNPIIKAVRAYKEKGVINTIKQLYMVGDLKFGVYKGCDAFGNKYYEDLDLPYGQHRWVEYADIHNFDATMIQPEWHGWMHHTYDETPTEKPAHNIRGVATHTGSKAPFKTNEYLSNLKPSEQQNTTQWRQRGYEVGSLKTGAKDPDMYYRQMGHPLHPKAHQGGRYEDFYRGGEDKHKRPSGK